MLHIGMDPNIFQAGNFILTWHGFFSFVAVVISVILCARWARSAGLEPDHVYATAIWAIIGGILGARIFHVIDRWDIYSNNPAEILAIWSGGIALFGSILGGLLAGTIYAKTQGFPVGKLADLAAPAILVGQTVGRIGDIINGEHIAKVTDLPWGFVYTHPDSLSYQVHRMLASHPVILYEMIWNTIVFGIVWWMRGRIRPDGMLFALYLGLYAFGRFFISFLREDKVWFAGLQEAHIIAIGVIAVALPLLIFKGNIVPRDEFEHSSMGARWKPWRR